MVLVQALISTKLEPLLRLVNIQSYHVSRTPGTIKFVTKYSEGLEGDRISVRTNESRDYRGQGGDQQKGNCVKISRETTDNIKKNNIVYFAYLVHYNITFKRYTYYRILCTCLV